MEQNTLKWADFMSIGFSSTPAGRRYQQLQHQVESLQDDLYRMETQKDDFRIKVELQEKELLELQQKVQYWLEYLFNH